MLWIDVCFYVCIFVCEFMNVCMWWGFLFIVFIFGDIESGCREDLFEVFWFR